MKVKISREAIELLLQYAAGAYPKEFFAFLKGRKNKEELVITNLFYHPQLNSEKSVSLLPSMETNTHGVLGTAHSHPAGRLHPSRADSLVFSKFPVNIICNKDHLRVFNNDGKGIPYELEDIGFNETEEDQLHNRILFDVMQEKMQWVSSYQNAIFLNVVAAVLIILLLTLFLF